MMRVQKRDGSFDDVSFDKVLRRLKNLSGGLDKVNVYELTQKVCGRIYDGVKTSELDELAAHLCSSLIIENPEYDTLASRIITSNHHKNTSPSYSEVTQLLFDNKLVSKDLYDVVMKNKEKLNNVIDYQRDHTYDYFGFKTLERSYLLKVGGRPVERVQHMLMRVAIGIHGADIKDALGTYDMMSRKLFIHATPTLFNAGTPREQMSSCFVAGTRVYTDKGAKPIEEVQIGDLVMTHKNRWRPVAQLHANPLGDRTLYDFKVHGSDTVVTATGNHEFMSVQRGPDKEPSWNALDDLVPGDFIMGYTMLGDAQAQPQPQPQPLRTKVPSSRRDPIVYTLGVEEDHSYTVEGLVAKNCYLVAMQDDSLEGIFDTLKDCALISKYAGGIGMHIHNIRARNAQIRGTNGRSDGVIPMLRVFNNAARYVNQGGKRNGSVAVFLEPWHADVMDFLDLRKNHGAEEERARDLFYAMWVPDLFMERVKANGTWSLMCPDQSKGLADVYGAEFEALYTSYEAQGLFIKQVTAQEVWFKILEAQIETGVPYIGFKDHVNRKTNQQNIGIIKSSNLCMEICQVSTPEETAVCNLASLCLKTFVAQAQGEGPATFDFETLHETTKTLVKNLNKIIDRNFYPLDKAKLSNKRHRPIGIGVQGLADAFALLRMPFDSPEAAKLNVDIFETIYHAAVEASMELAKKHKRPYSTFDGSPMSRGQFQFDMWGITPPADRYDWPALKASVIQHGMLNSLLISPMPTASTSQIMSANECFEPFTSNIYKRKTMAGEFIIVNKYLVADLQALGLWTPAIRDQIILHDGSVQEIPEIPEDIRRLYKTVWEIKQKVLINMAADRGPYICQSQSMNLFVESPDFRRLSSMHFYSWDRGLKTGIYYLRSKAKAKVQQFTLDPKLTKLANVGGGSNTSACDGMICEACQ